MGLTFEHESIARALISAGMAEGYLRHSAIESAQTLPVCVGWSQRQSLLLRPEYAWLSLPEVSYLQLPVPLDLLIRQIEASSHPGHTIPGLALLTTTLGQWRWALAELQRASESEYGRELSFRLSALRLFAIKHWPGWYEKILNDLAARIARTSSVSSGDVQRLVGRADEVAILEAYRPLLGWSGGEAKGERIAALEDALSYVNQGVGRIDGLANLVALDPWWDEMDHDLSAAEKMLRRVGPQEGVPELASPDRLRVLRECLASIRSLSEAGASSDKTLEAGAAVSTLIEILEDIVKQRRQLLAELSR